MKAQSVFKGRCHLLAGKSGLESLSLFAGGPLITVRMVQEIALQARCHSVRGASAFKRPKSPPISVLEKRSLVENGPFIIVPLLLAVTCRKGSYFISFAPSRNWSFCRARVPRPCPALGLAFENLLLGSGVVGMDFEAISLFRLQTHTRFLRNTRHRHLQSSKKDRHSLKDRHSFGFKPDWSLMRVDIAQPQISFLEVARFHFLRL